MFRIVQAALTNAPGMRRRRRALIAVTMRRNDLSVMVADNGKGMTRKTAHSHDSIGISGMRERALALGGTFTLGRSGGKGTVLTKRIRCPASPAGQRPRGLNQNPDDNPAVLRTPSDVLFDATGLAARS